MSGSDLPGFDEFVVARRPALLRTAYLLVGDLHDAEDLVQAALAKAYPHWTRISHRPEPYVRKVLARESVTRWRARRWREVATHRLPEGPATAADAAEVRTGQLVLAAALAGLPPRQRAVIVLRYFDDLTERETARHLGITVGTVKSQASAALAKLRDALPDLTGSEP